MQAAKRRTWTTAAAVAVLCVVATAWPAAAAPWPPADVAGVETTSPLLAAVDVKLEPAPPAPIERAEITLALQPPRSWAGLLDLGIPSGESPSLSETRVWGFFLGSPDCVGLERLQVPDSTGDASFFARSLRHGVFFARNNPVGFTDPTGLYAGASNEELADAHHAMTPEQQEQFAEAQTTALMATGGVALAFTPGPEDAVIAVAGAKFAARAAGKVGSFFRKLFRGADNVTDAGSAASRVPGKATETLDYVRQTGRAPDGYKGGRKFQNREGKLPEDGHYKEYDVDPKPPSGEQRNAERIVVDENSGRAWYTNDHYETFVEVK